MRFKFIYIIIILISGSFCYSQTKYSEDSLKYSEDSLRYIYQKIVFPDDSLERPEWKIDDINLISEIIRYLIANNELKEKKNDSLVNKTGITKLWKQVHENKVRIRCRRRENDNQIDHIELLVNDSVEYKPLDNWLFIKDALSEPMYEIVNNKNYSYTDIKQDYINSDDKSFVMLNVLRSEAVFIYLDGETKGLSSVYYQLGCDNINLPSWYKGSINVGLKFKLLPASVRNRFDYEWISLAIGWDGPLSFPVQKIYLPGFMESMFNNRLLHSTSDNLFISGSYSPLTIGDSLLGLFNKPFFKKSFVRFHIEGSFPYYESKESLPPSNIDNFYSVRGHASLSGSVCNIGEIFNAGGSFSYYQLYNYSKNPTTNDLSILGSKKHYLFSIEPAISREDKPFQYYFSPQINFDLSDGQKFFVLKSSLMFFNSFGIEFKYFESLNKRNVEPWHYKNYVIISPIIRINY